MRSAKRVIVSGDAESEQDAKKSIALLQIDSLTRHRRELQADGFLSTLAVLTTAVVPAR
jgi:hypothetical protein